MRKPTKLLDGKAQGRIIVDLHPLDAEGRGRPTLPEQFGVPPERTAALKTRVAEEIGSVGRDMTWGEGVARVFALDDLTVGEKLYLTLTLGGLMENRRHAEEMNSLADGLPRRTGG